MHIKRLMGLFFGANKEEMDVIYPGISLCLKDTGRHFIQPLCLKSECIASGRPYTGNMISLQTHLYDTRHKA